MTNRMHTLVAFVSGCALTAVLGWATARVAASPDDPPIGAIHICVAADGVMRQADVAAPCPAGQRSLFFQRASAGVDQPDNRAPNNQVPRDPNAGCADPARIAALEQELTGLEATADHSGLGRRVLAPFEVVDRAGKRLFLVEEGGVSVFAPNGRAVAKFTASDTGGRFAATSGDGERSANLGSGEGKSGLIIFDKKPRVEIIGSDTDVYNAKFYTAAGNMVAGVGEGLSGSGLAIVRTAAGTLAASMEVNDNKGRIVVVQPGGKGIAELTEGQHGGLLAIYGTSGERMVEAGVVPAGFGVVRAGPDGFNPGVGLLGLPGSYIAGKK